MILTKTRAAAPFNRMIAEVGRFSEADDRRTTELRSISERWNRARIAFEVRF